MDSLANRSEDRVSVDEALKNTKNILSRAHEHAVAALRPFAQRKLQEDEVFACFELWNVQDYGMRYNTFFRKNDDGRAVLDPHYATFDESDSSFIPELDNYLNDIFTNTKEWSEKEENDFDARHEAQLFQWFSECWEEAGGNHSIVPTFFCFEKEYSCRDLVTGEIMTENEAARRLGYIVTG